MSIEVDEDGTVELGMAEVAQFAEVGLHFVLACAVAGTTTTEVMQQLLDKGKRE